jgi:hypothetical protein
MSWKAWYWRKATSLPRRIEALEFGIEVLEQISWCKDSGIHPLSKSYPVRLEEELVQENKAEVFKEENHGAEDEDCSIQFLGLIR